MRLYKKDNEDMIKCLLCPHFCLLKEGQKGKCGVRERRGTQIFLNNYGQLTHVAVEPIEKKPFKHFLSGSKTLSIGGYHCNLQCFFCENYEFSQRNRADCSKYFSPINLILLAQEKQCQSICMTFNEPIISIEYLLDVAKECHKNNIKFIIKTNGYANREPWGEICDNVDAMNIDWKGNAKQYKKVSKGDKYVINDRIQEAYNKGIHIEISIPVYPDFLEDIRAFYKCAHFFGGIDTNIPCHVLKVNMLKNTSSDKKIQEDGTITSSLVHHILSFYMKYVYKY